MHLQKQKNSCTFEATTKLERSNANFLNQNKTQASRCKSCNFRLSGSVVSDLGYFLQPKSHMTTEKNIPPYASQSTASHNDTLLVTKVECEGPDQFAIHVKVRNSSTTVIRFSNPGILEEALKSLLKTNQQQKN
jgi:hypothetical protein